MLQPELNFFIDLLDFNIDTGLLTSEVIRSNQNSASVQSYIKHTVNKILREGYYTSILFK